MKIVCEACQAKYSIADEKVRGKVFKIRCKKCSHVIVVRGTGEHAATSGELSPSAPAPASAAPVESAWHIVVDGEQVGPLPESDIKARLSRKEISGDTYIWKEGFSDWVKISTLTEFASGGEPPSPFTPPSSPAVEANIFGTPGAGYQPGSSGSFAAAPNGSEPDVFAAPAPAPSSSGMSDLFASPSGGSAEPAAAVAPVSAFSGFEAPMASDSYGGRAGGNGSPIVPASGLTGQRHENSVLFSLSNLEALAKPSPAPMPSMARAPSASAGPSEGSGLIDIRAMASMTLGSSGGSGSGADASDLPAFSAPQFSPVAPVLLPVASSSGPPKWALALLGVLGLMIIVLGYMALKLFGSSSSSAVAPQPASVAAPAPSPAGAAPAPARAQEPPSTPPPPADEKLPPREPSTPPAAAAQRTDRGSTKAASGGRSSAGGRKNAVSKSAEPVVAALPAPTPKAEKPEAPARPKDDLERLLEAAGGSRKPKREEEDVSAKPAQKADPLGREDVVKGMGAISPKAHECFVQYKVPGIVNVKVTVNPGGKVTKVDVTGKFAGTPSGSCVEAAVKTAKFPANPGQSFDYIVPLR